MRPLPLSELFDEVFRLYRRRFSLLFVTSVFAVVPWAILAGAGFAFAAALGFFTGTPGRLSGTPSTAELAVAVVAVLIGIALAPIAVYAVWRAAVAAVLGEAITVGAVLQQTLASYWRLWWLAIGYGFLTLVCGLLIFTCLLIPLSAWLLVKWSLTVPAWFIERRGLGPSLSRSWNLSQGYWWRLLGILLVFYALYQAVSYGLSSFSFALGFVPQQYIAAGAASQVVLQLLLGMALGPLFPLVLTLLYLDLRVRHEHLDLELMALQIAGRQVPGQLPPPPAPLPAPPAPPPPAPRATPPPPPGPASGAPPT